MRTLALLAGLLLVGLCLPTRSAEVTKGPLAPLDAKNQPQNVPAAFHPYNVTVRERSAEELTEEDKEAMEKGLKDDKEKEKDKEKYVEEKYTSKDKYHCLITEYDLDPVVMLFARGLNDSAGFRDLLKKLDAACKKYRGRRLRAFVVFLDKDLTNFYEVDPDKRKEQDAKRKEMVKAADTMATELELKNVVLTIGASEDEPLKKYELGDSALTVVLYRALRIRNSHTFTADELDKKDAPAVDSLIKDVEKRLVPK